MGQKSMPLQTHRRRALQSGKLFEERIILAVHSPLPARERGELERLFERLLPVGQEENKFKLFSRTSTVSHRKRQFQLKLPIAKTTYVLWHDGRLYDRRALRRTLTERDFEMLTLVLRVGAGLQPEPQDLERERLMSWLKRSYDRPPILLPIPAL